MELFAIWNVPSFSCMLDNICLSLKLYEKCGTPDWASWADWTCGLLLLSLLCSPVSQVPVCSWHPYWQHLPQWTVLLCQLAVWWHYLWKQLYTNKGEKYILVLYFALLIKFDSMKCREYHSYNNYLDWLPVWMQIYFKSGRKRIR